MRQTSSTTTHAMKAERGIDGVAPRVNVDWSVVLVPVNCPEFKRNVTISHN